MLSRRRFLQSSVSLALLPLLPRVVASADLSVRTRPNWNEFCTGPLFGAYVDAIAAMRANRDTSSPASWGYWVNVHETLCPHGLPYFLAWHRGLLYSFENSLREVSGEETMVLPYWDYYTQPQVPPEFLDTSSALWRKNRTGSDVTGALSLAPFDDSVTHFKRGTTNAFETKVETAPHNPVHNLIGGAMGDISISPRDPLFWVHHANIDRLWVAWFAAGGGRSMPKAYKPYWQGSFDYGSAVAAIPRAWTRSTTRYLQYQYADQSMPTALPPPGASSATAMAATTSPFALSGALPRKPAAVRSTALDASQPLLLDEHSISVEVALSTRDANRVRSLLLRPADTQATAMPAADPLCLVLDGVQLTALGAKGGYFYKIYVNLPDEAGLELPEDAYLLGLLGSFEITVAQMKVAMQGAGMPRGMHAARANPQVRFVYPLSEALRRNWPTHLDTLSVSFVRVDGRSHPARGGTIRIQAFSVEAAA